MILGALGEIAGIEFSKCNMSGSAPTDRGNSLSDRNLHRNAMLPLVVVTNICALGEVEPRFHGIFADKRPEARCLGDTEFVRLRGKRGASGKL